MRILGITDPFQVHRGMVSTLDIDHWWPPLSKTHMPSGDQNPACEQRKIIDRKHSSISSLCARDMGRQIDRWHRINAGCQSGFDAECVDVQMGIVQRWHYLIFEQLPCEDKRYECGGRAASVPLAGTVRLRRERTPNEANSTTSSAQSSTW